MIQNGQTVRITKDTFEFGELVAHEGQTGVVQENDLCGAYPIQVLLHPIPGWADTDSMGTANFTEDELEVIA